MLKKWPLFILSVTCFFTSSSQEIIPVIKKSNYNIDPSMQVKLNQNELFSAALDIEWIQDDKESMPGVLSGKNMPCYSFYHVEKDTVRIFLMQPFAPAGVIINIVNDSAWAIHYVSPKDNSLRDYKLSTTDTEYQYSPLASSVLFKLILKKTPLNGEPVEGYIEYKSVGFFQKWTNGDIKRNYNLKGYFSAKQM